MPTNCVFKFDRATPIYYSGEQICGNITLTTTKLLRLEAIIINCKGIGQVNWYDNAAKTVKIEYNDSNKDDDPIQYQGNESYINENLTAQERIQLHAGQHEYKFLFNLPPLCPATCIQKYGEIFYSVNLILKRRAKYDKIFEQRFIVKNRMDLNEDRDLAQNLDKQTHNGIHFSISRTGFVPGQDIKFCLKVPKCELALKNMQKLRVRLCQKYIFKCQQPVTDSKDLLWTVAMAKSDISADILHSYEARLRIPLLTPITSADPKTIISVSYYMEAVILSKQKFVLSKFTIPITLGTKALKSMDTDLDFELGDFCYDNFKVASGEVSHENTDFNSTLEKEPPSYVDISAAKSLADYDHSPLLAIKKLRRFTNSNIIRMPVNICIQLFHML